MRTRQECWLSAYVSSVATQERFRFSAHHVSAHCSQIKAGREMADAGDHEMVRRKEPLTATNKTSSALFYSLTHVVSLQADDGDMDPELAQVSRTAVYRALSRHLVPEETLCSAPFSLPRTGDCALHGRSRGRRWRFIAADGGRRGLGAGTRAFVPVKSTARKHGLQRLCLTRFSCLPPGASHVHGG
jgi:hypothetical protein